MKQLNIKKITFFLAFICFFSGVMPAHSLYGRFEKHRNHIVKKKKSSWKNWIKQRFAVAKSFVKRHKKKLAIGLVTGIITYCYLRGYISPSQPKPPINPSISPIYRNPDLHPQQQQTVIGATPINCFQLNLPPGQHERHWQQRVVDADTGNYGYIHRPTGQHVIGVMNNQRQITHYNDMNGNRVFGVEEFDNMQRLFAPIDAQFTLPENIQIQQVQTARQHRNSCAYNALKNSLLILNEFELNNGNLDQQLNDEQLMNQTIGTEINPGLWRQHVMNNIPETADRNGDWVNRQGVNQLIQLEDQNRTILNPASQAPIIAIEDTDLRNHVFNEPITQAIRAQVHQEDGPQNYGFVMRSQAHWVSAVLHKNPDNSMNWVFASSNRRQPIMQWPGCQLLIAAICGNPV